MAEPTTTTAFALIAAGVTVPLLVPGLDGNAVVGAFAGAALVALHARDVSALWRIGYLIISWIIGYLAAPEIARRTGVSATGVAAFIGAALAIAITAQVMERIKTFDFGAWLASVLRRGGP
jgi:hypothetical protein